MENLTSAAPVQPISVTLPEAARLTGLSTATLRRHAAAGRLRLVKVGGRTLVPFEALRGLVRVDEK